MEYNICVRMQNTELHVLSDLGLLVDLKNTDQDLEWQKMMS